MMEKKFQPSLPDCRSWDPITLPPHPQPCPELSDFLGKKEKTDPKLRRISWKTLIRANIYVPQYVIMTSSDLTETKSPDGSAFWGIMGWNHSTLEISLKTAFYKEIPNIFKCCPHTFIKPRKTTHLFGLSSTSPSLPPTAAVNSQ